MTTIAKMVTEIGADASDLRRGVEQGVRHLESFANQAKKLSGMELLNAYRLAQQGQDAADALLGGITDRFAMEAADAREELFRGLIDKREFERRARDSAQAFNAEILAGMKRLAESGQLTGDVHRKLVAELKNAGLQAGREAGAGIRAGLSQTSTTVTTVNNQLGLMGRLVNQNTGRWTELGRRAATVGGQASFALGMVASGGVGALKSVRGLTTAVGGLAAGFGPQGALVGGVIFAGGAIAQMLLDSRRDIEKTAETWEESLRRMVNASDLIGLQKELQRIQFGEPDAGISAFARAFVGSLEEARARAAALAAEIAKVPTPLGKDMRRIVDEDFDKLVKEHERWADEVVRLQGEYDKVADKIQLVGTLPLRAARGGMIGAAPVAEVRTLAREMQDLLARAQELTGAQGLGIEGLGQAQVRIFDQVTARLREQNDELGETAIALRKVREEMLKLPVVNFMRGDPGRPQMQQTGRVNTLGRVGGQPVARDVQIAIDPVIRAMAVVAARSQALASALTTASAAARSFWQNVRDAGSGVLAEFGAMATIMRVFQPLVEVLIPAFQALLIPLITVARVVSALLIPVFRLFFPVIRAVGIVFTVLGEVVARVTAGLAEAVGSVIKALGKLIGIVPGLGSLGRSIQRMGQSILRFAKEQRAVAEDMRQARRELKDLSWEDAVEQVDELGDAARQTAEALRNVPQWFRVSLARFNATNPIVTAPEAPAAASAAAVQVVIESLEVNGVESPQQLLDEILGAARNRARATTGNMADWNLIG